MRKQLRGVVTSDKNDKTIRVEVERRYRHAKYGKIVRGRTVCHTHDENNEAKIGDVVEIVECRPRSALKRWELVQIVTRADQTQVAAAAEIGKMDPTAPQGGDQTQG
jgi:small subunit ribosomal protein S17